MKKEIGSDFNINLKLFFNKTKNNILKNSILLSSGNDCISYILKENKTKILLPSYLCKNILIPLKEENVKYSFYKINKKLQIDLEDLEYKIKKENPGMILIIHYFGFIQPNMDKIMNICTKNKIILIEDHVQSFLSKPKMKGDYLFNSYRKYLQIPDGAFLIKKTHTKIKIYNSPKKYVLKRFCAGILKNLIFLKKIWRKLFIDAEKKLIHNHKKPAKMSRISIILLKKFNLYEIKLRRRRNYFFLDKYLNSLFPKLDANVCPIGFPILLESKKERDQIKNKLIKNKIYASIHWALPTEISKKEFKDSWEISNRILTIPLDQRYNKKDMARIIKVMQS